MRCFLVALLFLLSIACNDRKRHYSNIVKQFYNKTIVFPDNLNAHIYGRDTVCPELFQARYKILNYVDTNGCTECRLKLFAWQQFKEKLDSLNADVSLIFIAHLNDFEQLEILQKVNRFNVPIFYDEHGSTDRLNYFPSEHHLHTFLLDSLNRIILIGNPLSSVKMEQLYLDKLSRGGTGKRLER